MLKVVNLPSIAAEYSLSISRMACSAVLSNALVASSMSIVVGRLINTLAMAMRCFWPPENMEPPSPTSVSIPSGNLLMNQHPVFSRESRISCFVHSGLTNSMLSRILPLKSTGSWPI
mmetsp:Transcript_134385/g.233578  ORF Transcript_134385/g.233578 Transcript_134385/m.233578 type:complete len:117 (+) Transcript_134385:2345-2695(+)